MYKFLIFLSLSLFLVHQLDAQVYPKEGSKLNYRIIGFACPPQTWATNYKIEIAAGSYNTEDAFYKNIISSVSNKKSKIIAQVPAFGAQYTWRIVFTGKDASLTKSLLYHFSTMMSPDVDTTTTRLRILKGAIKYKDAYVFVDGTRTLYDMNGKPVWFLPGSDHANKTVDTRDLKITPKGTITFITKSLPYEINYDGNILWCYKGNQSTDTFHHEFTRLDNGNYMGMIYENEYTLLPLFKDSIARNAHDSTRFYRNIQFSSIVEYDKNNRLVWHWSGSEYIKNSDLRLRENEDMHAMNHDFHENAFYFDEKNKTIYLSFRNISRIVKIKYPQGNVLNTYGTTYKPGIINWGNDLFSSQHSCRASQKGYLYIFNNNTSSLSGIPTILMMQEPAPGKTDLKKIWEYKCTIEGPDSAASYLLFHSGGNVIELPDESIFVCMSQPYSKIFIVSHDKNILWSAIPETYDTATKKWGAPEGTYRASIITSRKDLEQLIWNSEKEQTPIMSL